MKKIELKTLIRKCRKKIIAVMPMGNKNDESLWMADINYAS